MNFTGTDMLSIDIANCYGMDKRTWSERLLWTALHHDDLEDLTDEADEKYLYIKAVHALRISEKGFATGHNMFLDGTASGLQVMAALSGCRKTAAAVNMIDTGDREDVYITVAAAMNELLPPQEHVSKNDIKKPLMTHYYNKSRQDTLSELQVEVFYEVVHDNFTGAEDVKALVNSYWDNEALEHTWTLPDGHVARVLVTDTAIARVEVDELDHTTFTYRFESNQPSNRNTSLCPNIIHSIDGYIVRQMIYKAHNAGFELAHIFDAFTCHPNYMGLVMQFYREVMADIADSNLLADILSEISGTTVILDKDSDDLSKDILSSQYMLS